MTAGSDEALLSQARMDVDVLGGTTAFRSLLASRYGPVGQKILLADEERSFVTSDLHRLLNEVELEHPAARIVASGAVEQKETVGDGSLAVVLLAGSLAAQARELLGQGLHRTTIAAGFTHAVEVATEEVAECARSVNGLNDPAMEGVARAGLASLFIENEPGVLDAVLDTVRLLLRKVDVAGDLSLQDIEFERNPRNAGNVELIRGTVLDESPISETTPTDLENVSVAILGGGRKAGHGIEERIPKRHGGEPGEGRTEMKLSPDTHADVIAMKRQERDQVDEQIDTVIEAGADVVFCNMGISDAARGRLRAEGIPAFRGLTSGRSRLLARATGARRIMYLADIGPSDLGRAGRFSVLTDADGEQYVLVEDCTNGEVATLLLPDTVEDSREELERDIRAAIVTALEVLQGDPVVPGGGTIEVALAAAVREAAYGIDDRSALVMNAYADALEELAGTLARNAGADPLEVLPALRAGGTDRSFDVAASEVRPVTPETPHHPANVVRGVVRTATDLAVQLTRIDQVLSAHEEDEDAIEDPDFSPNIDSE